ncbi:hypothetical protein [Microbulbifer elongatus]|uniref:hypothetical protein n=1 Tax=Microbulbifer elongatus TaxID=86173 RepID=UPI001CFEC03E|nr:hypothetical protein [Microbulbifer elongatus]
MQPTNTLQSRVRWLQLRLNPAAPLSPGQIRVHFYRDRVDNGILDTLNTCFQQQSPLPEHTPESYTAFILCKPSATIDALEVHALECLDDNGEPNGELWLKLKSGAGLATLFGVPDGESILPLTALQQSLLKGVALPPMVALPQQDGPSWLCTPLRADDEIWQLPVLETPLDVPARFAGHCYMKLVTQDHPACPKSIRMKDEASQ